MIEINIATQTCFANSVFGYFQTQNVNCQILIKLTQFEYFITQYICMFLENYNYTYSRAQVLLMVIPAVEHSK